MSEIEINNLEITSVCNYHCPICVTCPRKSNIKMEDFYKIVDNNYHLFNKNGVWLHYYGEPLVNIHLPECVQYIKSKGAKARISTNGFLLDDKRRELVAKSGLDYVVVSISTLDRDVYKNTRGKDNLPIVLENIKNFKEYIDANNIKMGLQAVMIDTAEDGGKQKQEFIEYFHKLGIDAAVHNFTNRSKSVSLDLFDENKHDYSAKRGVCVGLEKRMVIMSNCEVGTCFCDLEGKMTLGNLRDYDYSLEKLLQNGKLDELREKLSKGIYEGACKNCTDWIYYQADSIEKYVSVYPCKKN